MEHYKGLHFPTSLVKFIMHEQLRKWKKNNNNNNTIEYIKRKPLRQTVEGTQMLQRQGPFTCTVRLHLIYQ